MRAPDFLLRIEISSYWCHATGRSGGADCDLVTDRDDDGLPVLRGRHVRGLLREACRLAEALEYPDAIDCSELFGGRGADSRPGLIAIGDARLPLAVAQGVAASAARKEALFRRLAATAIEPATGIAKSSSLRSIEVAIPCVLFAPISIEGDKSGFKEGLDQALPLIAGVGAKRSRGLGRARMSLVESS